MRHHYHRYKLNRTTSHRKALMKNMSVSLIMHERIKTTVTKAKFLRPYCEKLITTGRKNDVATVRLLSSRLNSDDAVRKLLSDISVRYKDRKGGYLRIIRIGRRKGDNAEMALIEMV